MGLKEIAVPGLEFQIELRPDATGPLQLLGDDLCGDEHPEMQGLLIVESQQSFRSWLEKHDARRNTAAAP